MPSAGRQTPLRLAEFAIALSLASDVGLGHPLEMVLATCLLSVRLGELLALSDDELRQVYYVALLRHAGCTADAPRVAEAFGDDVAMSPAFLAEVDPTRPWGMLNFIWRNMYLGRPLPARLLKLGALFPAFMEGVLAHCEVAQLFARRLGLDEQVQAALLQCNEDWNGRGVPGRLKGEAIARPVRVMRVAEEAVYLNHFVAPKAVTTNLRRRAGVTLDPAIVEKFCASANRLMQPLDPDASSLRREALAAEPGARPLMTETQLDAAAQALADFADLKAPHFVDHSAAVARLAGEAARRFGLSEADAARLQRAGCVHDVGRIGVSAGIWCKPGPLTDTEWEQVRLHPYLTVRILAHPQILADWGSVAGAHHERLDGTGYHRNWPAPMLTPAMRLLAAAEVYQAMREARPYRPPLPPERAAAELKREARSGRLDGDAVAAVLAAAGHSLRPARPQRVAGLTEREIEILGLVARGSTNREIARRLTLSQKTVGNHLQNIYGKLGVSTRAAATYFAMQHHIA